ncbi:MAG: class I SAM-dependent methyltransferase [Anaerolineales bacterium]
MAKVKAMNRNGTRDQQAEFFDENPPLYPWPSLLRAKGLSSAYKPREAMWKLALESAGLNHSHRMLDIGCATGIWLDRLKSEFGIKGDGIDVSTGSLRKAAVDSLHPTTYICGDASSLPIADGLYDFVLCLDVLEHISGQQTALSEIARVLKPGGRVMLWTLNRKQDHTWNWWLSRFGIDIYDRSAHDPELLPDADEVCEHLRTAGMQIEAIEFFNSFFTLAIDEIIMVTISLLKKTGLFDSQLKISLALGQIYLAIADQLSRRSLKLLNFLDSPWRKKHHSNGFLVVGTKTIPLLRNTSEGSEVSARQKREAFEYVAGHRFNTQKASAESLRGGIS